KAGASGDTTLKGEEESNHGVAWFLPQAGPGTATPLVYEGYVYVLDDRGGFLSCHEAKTGKQVYRQRLQGARGFTSSPWAQGGKVYCLDQSGTTFVVQAGEEVKLVGRNKLDGLFWSSPAAARGALFLRGVDHLYCVRE